MYEVIQWKIPEEHSQKVYRNIVRAYEEAYKLFHLTTDGWQMD